MEDPICSSENLKFRTSRVLKTASPIRTVQLQLGLAYFIFKTFMEKILYEKVANVGT